MYIGRNHEDVARWYDVKVTFDNENLKGLFFTCTLDRYDEIEKLLRFFEEVYNIEFKILIRGLFIYLNHKSKYY